MKVYRIKPDQILDVVKATSDRRPELDELSRRAAGEAYEQRWAGTDHLFGGPAPVPVSEEPAPARPRGRGVTADWGTPRPGGETQDTINRAEDARRRLHEAMSETAGRDDDLDAQFRKIIAGGGVTWQPPAAATPGEDGDPRREMVFDIVAKAGPDGIGPEAIRDAISRLHPGVEVPHAATIGRWLSADPRIHRPRFGRYAVRPTEN
ncbi:FtsK domain-containing protein OS=Streptomyces fumanus OX=67302 GN=GCM10018772_05140 PE=4 SV=1 [Streptomyces fumanus]